MKTKEELVKLIQEYATAYYLGEAKVTDTEFDSLVDELRAICPNHYILQQVGWGLKVYGQKVKLPCEIKHSLDKIHEITPEWKDAVVSAKIDGMSCVLEYEKGTLKLAVTRGDGIDGIDFTSKSIHIPTIPSIINTDKSVCIRGELYIDLITFREYLSSDYKNPRNIVSGIINSKSLRNLGFVKFIAHPQDFQDRYLPIPYLTEYVQTEDILDFKDAHKDVFEYYPTDGLVLRHSGNHDAIAYKFETEKFETTITEIQWNVCKGGKLIPVAIYEPVEMFGTTCTRATALHYDYVKRHKLGPGAKILVTKANDIIPQIVEVLSPSTSIEEKYLPKDEYVVEGLHAIKVDKDLVYNQALDHFIKWHFDIDGFKRSEKILREVFDVNDFYSLRETFLWICGEPLQAIKMIEDYGVKSYAEKWVDNARAPKYSDQFFMQVGIDGVGESASKELDKFIDGPTLCHGDLFEMYHKADINITVKKALTKYEHIFIQAYEVFDNWKWKPKETKKKFKVKACITGSLSVTKEEFAKVLAEKGIEYVDYVDKTVGILITPNVVGRESSKIKKAKSLGIKILTEAEARGIEFEN